jgi:hypothetical protein
MQHNREQRDELPSEVAMLCSLLARIIYRCLKERDARLLALLKEPTSEHAGEHDAPVSGRLPDQSA